MNNFEERKEGAEEKTQKTRSLPRKMKIHTERFLIFLLDKKTSNKQRVRLKPDQKMVSLDRHDFLE